MNYSEMSLADRLRYSASQLFSNWTGKKETLIEAASTLEQHYEAMRLALAALEGCYGRTTGDGVNRVRAMQKLHQLLTAQEPKQ